MGQNRPTYLSLMWILFCLINSFCANTSSAADGLQDNVPDKVRRVPKLGIELNSQQQNTLTTQLKTLKEKLDLLKLKAAKSPGSSFEKLLPDVEIFYNAVEIAKTYQEFFKPAEVKNAMELLKIGNQRADQLGAGKAPWTSATGLVVRGFRSKIDGTAQPYGLVIPKDYDDNRANDFRLDIWFHGRGETLSENNFIFQRMKNKGTYAPEKTIVLHPYGRYSNAFKLAGEVDTLEGIESVRDRYRIDPHLISVRGFSMGGAGCWQMAVHFPGDWFAANPGAGFSETPKFLKFFQKETLAPTWYEKKLWNLYDCDKWAENLKHCPTYAYSGADDIQKQAADVMAGAMSDLKMQLDHTVWPKTKHRIPPEAAAVMESKMSSAARAAKLAQSRNQIPKNLTFTTFTLKYNRLHWLTIDSLQEHWKKARIETTYRKYTKTAQDSPKDNKAMLSVKVENINAFTIDFDKFWQEETELNLIISTGRNFGQFKVERAATLGGKVTYEIIDGKWRGSPNGTKDVLRKKHDLQGPIDDAFLDSFLFVTPSGKSRHSKFQKWMEDEMDHAKTHWRRHFRGVARTVLDKELTLEQIRSSNLILWGDRDSNQVISQIIDQLPIQWNSNSIQLNKLKYNSDKHALVCVYPNPLNPEKYIVLNSGFTFREFAYLNNARQVPKLPDWAIIDLDTKPNSQWPGKVVNANFFDEFWQLK